MIAEFLAGNESIVGGFFCNVCVVSSDWGTRKRTMVTDLVGRGVCLSLLYTDHMDFHRGSYWGKRGGIMRVTTERERWRPNRHGERSENGFPGMIPAIGLSQGDLSRGKWGGCVLCFVADA